MKLIKLTSKESKVETSEGTAYLLKVLPKGWATSTSWIVTLNGNTETFNFKYEALKYIETIK